jgi:hypothetical protein
MVVGRDFSLAAYKKAIATGKLVLGGSTRPVSTDPMNVNYVLTCYRLRLDHRLIVSLTGLYPCRLHPVELILTNLMIRQPIVREICRPLSLVLFGASMRAR